ncbi:MAG TPA: DUF3011 domain-containing protein [Longimicrobium sp.]|nr:DUF3011 domain-containing protein [Longimicrobium sp.]
MRKLGFLVVLAAAWGAVPTPAQAQQVVTCESSRGRRETCSVDTRGEVRLTRRLSDAACVRGRSWGVQPGAVWVDDGCRAQFAVTRTRSGGYDGSYGGGTSGRGNNDDWRRNERNDRYRGNGSAWALARCRSAVQRQVGSRRLNVWMEDDNRNRTRVGWRASDRLRGTCRIDREGRVDVRTDRNR